MNRKSIGRILAVLLILLLSLPVPVRAADKYMTGEATDVQIVLDETGGASVRETWQCYFGGDTISRYRRFYTVPEPDSMELTIQEVKMDGATMKVLQEPDESRPEGCLYLGKDGEEISLEMYVNALNERHTFEISYYVSNVVTLYEDVAEFHWNLTSEQEAFDIEKLTGTIEIPYGTRDMGLYFWGHGPSENASFVAEPDEDGMVNRFRLENENIPKDRAVTVRFAMPRELFPEAQRIREEEALQDILREEHSLADYSGSAGETVPYEGQAEHPEDGPWWQSLLDFGYAVLGLSAVFLGDVAVLLALAPTLVLFSLRSRMERKAREKYIPSMLEKYREKPRMAPEYYVGLPATMKPALVFKLMTCYPSTEEGSEILGTGDAFSATVLDLIEEGLIEIRGDGAYFVKPEAEEAVLTPYEENVISLYTAAGAAETPKTTEEITDYMRSSYDWCKKHYREFNDAVEKDFEAQNLLQDGPGEAWSRQKKIRVGLIFGGLIFVGALFSRGLLMALLLGVISGLVNGLVLGRIHDIRHPQVRVLTQEGEDLYALFKGYRAYLESSSNLDEKKTEDVKTWRKHLVYACALGCCEQVTEQLRMHLPRIFKSLVRNDGLRPDFYRYDDLYRSVESIKTENGYTIRNTSFDTDSGSFDSGDDWGGFSDCGGDSDCGCSGSDFD